MGRQRVSGRSAGTTIRCSSASMRPPWRRRCPIKAQAPPLAPSQSPCPPAVPRPPSNGRHRDADAEPRRSRSAARSACRFGAGICGRSPGRGSPDPRHRRRAPWTPAPLPLKAPFPPPAGRSVKRHAMPAKAEVPPVVARSCLFQGLTGDEVARIFARAHLRSFTRDEPVITDGDLPSGSISSPRAASSVARPLRPDWSSPWASFIPAASLGKAA